MFYEGDCDDVGACPALFLIASRGGRPRVISRYGGEAGWSPDSRQIVYTDGFGLVRFDIATHRSRRVARFYFRAWGWSFSPTGDKIVYAVGRRGQCFYGAFDLFVVAVTGGRPRRLTRDGCNALPVWSTDGIAFAHLIHFRGWGRHEIWRINANGTGRRTILGPIPARLLGHGITGFVPISWSGDAQHLLAGLKTEFGHVPYLIDARSGTTRRIAATSSSSRLSRDARLVLVSVENVRAFERSEVQVISVKARIPRVIARGAGEADWNL